MPESTNDHRPRLGAPRRTRIDSPIASNEGPLTTLAAGLK
jgi:hypothetical protein